MPDNPQARPRRPENSDARHDPAEARRIGRMVLAHWLSYPPERYEKLAEAVTGSAVYRRLGERIQVVLLPGMLVRGDDSQLISSLSAVARLQPDVCSVAYRHPAWGREFQVDGAAPTTGDETDREADWLLRRLRLINTRNWLTHLILISVMRAQAAFLQSGECSDLEPLTLSELARRLADSPLPPRLETLDVSLISRAVRRGLTVGAPRGDELPLRRLLPSAQTVLRYRLRALLEAEMDELKRDALERPRKDGELRQEVQARWGQSVSRRTVTAARQALGFPPWHRRAGRPVYPPPGFDFSPQRPMTLVGILAHAPGGPGVYEIALGGPALAYPTRASPVIYLGRSRNLRSRLRAHLRNQEKFGPEPGDGRLLFRFATAQAGRLRQIEAELIAAFRAMHGALPRCNRITPSGSPPD